MRVITLLAVVLIATAMRVGAAEKPAAPTDSARRAAEGWPATKAGERAAGWVEAFSTGEKAMKAYLETAMASGSMKSRNMNQRIESYRSLREKYGKLTLGSVVESKPYDLTAKLMASDGSLHGFVFKVEPQPPHGLLSVSIQQRGHGFGFHH
jgi:hypothetical protein